MGLGRGFGAGFLQGVQGAKMGMDAYYQAQDREKQEALAKELQTIGSAKPEQGDGFTASDGDALTKLSATHDVVHSPNDNAYLAISKSDPSDVQRFAQRGITDFLGTRTEGTAPMSNSQVSAARQAAMAGAVMKYNPREGLDLQIKAEQGQREAARFGRETSAWGREDDAIKKEQQYEKEREALLSSSDMAKETASHEAAMANYTKRKEQYEADLGAGKTGPELGIAPLAPPVRKAFTPGDQLAQWSSLIFHDAKYRKINTEGLMNAQGKIDALKKEGYLSAIQLAQAGATPEAVAAEFNKQGGLKIDPASLSISTAKDSSGAEFKKLTYIDPSSGQSVSIDTKSELAKVGKLQDILDQHYKGKADTRADEGLKIQKGQLGVAQSTAAANNRLHNLQADQVVEQVKDKQDYREALEKHQAALDSGNPVEIERTRKKFALFGPTRGKSSGLPAEIQMASAIYAEGGAKTMAEALDKAHTKKQPSDVDLYMSLAVPKGSGMPLSEADVQKHFATAKKLQGANQSATPGLQVGAIQKGDDGNYVFLGGDHKKKENWRKQ